MTGPLSDRIGLRWDQSMLGYAMTAVAVPLIAENYSGIGW